MHYDRSPIEQIPDIFSNVQMLKVDHTHCITLLRVSVSILVNAHSFKARVCVTGSRK